MQSEIGLKLKPVSPMRLLLDQRSNHGNFAKQKLTRLFFLLLKREKICSNEIWEKCEIEVTQYRQGEDQRGRVL